MAIKDWPYKTSKRALNEMGNNKKKVKRSWRPYDNPDCSCELLLNARMQNQDFRYFECQHSKEWMKKYKIVCKACGEVLGRMWSKNKDFNDYCDLHYESWYDKDAWRGCYGFHIDPFSSEPKFECCCGNKEVDGRFTTYKMLLDNDASDSG